MAMFVFVVGILFVFAGLLMGGAWYDAPPICSVLYAIAFVFFTLAVWMVDGGTTIITPIFATVWLLTGVLVLESLFRHVGGKSWRS